MEGFEQRSVTLSDLCFNRSIPAADLRIDIRKTRGEAGKLVRRLFSTQMRDDGLLDKGGAEGLVRCG